jgi:hypothetical protein
VSAPSIRARHTANSTIGTNRLDQYGNAAAPRAQQGSLPPAVPQPGDNADSPIKVESSPEPAPTRARHARAGSVTMTDAPPFSYPAGVTTTRSRSSYIREPNVDYSNPAVAERVAQMHEQRAADIRAGRVPRGSPSTASPGSGLSSPESPSMAIRGPGRRVAAPHAPQLTPLEEESTPSPTYRANRGANRGLQVQRTDYGGTHIRFPSDGDGSSTSRGRGGSRGHGRGGGST